MTTIRNKFRLSTHSDTVDRRKMKGRGCFKIASGVLFLSVDTTVALAEANVPARSVPETSVALGSILFVVVGIALLSLIGAFIVRLATLWVCGKSATYGQGYKTFFLTNTVSSLLGLSLPMLFESISKAKLPVAVIVIGALIGIALWPTIYGKLIKVEGNSSIGLRKGIYVSLILIAFNGLLVLIFGGLGMFVMK